MKKIFCMILILVYCLNNSCVQKSEKQKVVFTLDTSKIRNVKSVGLRGGYSPLSWDRDTDMSVLFADSIYTSTVIFNTGYRFVNVKFVINGQFELENLPNRRVEFDEDQHTEYHAFYDQPSSIQ